MIFLFLLYSIYLFSQQSKQNQKHEESNKFCRNYFSNRYRQIENEIKYLKKIREEFYKKEILVKENEVGIFLINF